MDLRIKEKVMETQPVFVQFSDLVRHYKLDSRTISGTASLGVNLIRGHAETRVSGDGTGSVLVNTTVIAAFVDYDGEVISHMMFADCDVE